MKTLKYLSLGVITLILYSCQSDNTKETETAKIEDVDTLDKEQALTDVTNQIAEFPKYSTVIEMLNASGDFTGHNVELIDSSEENVHVRISSEFIKDEAESVMTEQVKRDIVYVTFQAFAQTDLNKITVTSIPIIRSSFNPNLEYDGKLQKSKKETISITRARATEIIEKYLQTKSFQDLYQLDGTLYLPSSKFDKLKYDELNNVFLDMK